MVGNNYEIVRISRIYDVIRELMPMTLKEIAIALNVSLDRVYYIFKKLNLKTQCKKEDRKWVVDNERIFWKIKSENYDIENRAFHRRSAKRQIEIAKNVAEYNRLLQINNIINASLLNDLNITLGRY